MADSSVEITQGSGTNIDTRTTAASGDNRQVIVIGAPSVDADVAPVDATAGLKVNLGADNDITGTVDLGATDNAVLDAIQTATEATQAAVEGTVSVDLGANNDVTVTGTVDLGATDNAVLDAIVTATEATQAAVEGTVSVDLGANNDVTVTSGAITETNSGAIKTAVETIDNAISGSEMQVDIVASLPAGTNGIGKLTANSGVDIGDVDVTSLPATPAGTNSIGKILPPDTDITAHTNYARKYYTSTGAATDGIIWSPAAGKRWHVTSLYFQVSADATVTFEDDLSAGDDPVLKGEYKAGSGIALTFDEKYPFASGEDAADLLVTTSAGNIYVTVIGYEV